MSSTENKRTAKELANHILPASSNLLGICFVILSFVKFNSLGKMSYVDEALALPILSYFVACILSYLSLRAKKSGDMTRFEHTADWFFIFGLLSLTIIALTFILEII